MVLKKEEFNIMGDIKLIEELKAQLICVIGEFFHLLTRGSNVAKDSVLECISSAMIILYLLGEKLGYSYLQIDENTKEKIRIGIIDDKNDENYGESLKKLHFHLKERRD